ncbi:flavocytochrome c [Wolinella succinogenes]|uniref:flavocytochrome c n=1 Tax=Wolinella succinogenes TaxID=844 RepID=UPI003C6FFDBF
MGSVHPEINHGRRDLIKLGAAGMGVVLLGEQALAEPKKGVKFDEEYDVIIVGSGFAGIACGIKCAEKGYKTLMIEKMGRIGGNSVINGGIFCVPQNDLQKKAGIKDSNELFIADCMKAGLGINHKELLETLAKRAHETYQFTLKYGAKYLDSLVHEGGHSVPRTYQTAVGSGAGIVLPLMEHFEKMAGVTLKTRTKFDDFVMDDAGRVIGILAREDYRFDSKLFSDDLENQSGTPKAFKATKAVMLASGGFCQDKYYRAVQDPRLTPSTDSTNHPGATAGVLLKAFEIGAVPVQVSWIQFGPWACPDEKGFGVGSMFNVNASFRYGISVDPKTGKRYMNELADRKIRADHMFAVIGKDENYPINLCDSQAIERLLPDHYEKALKAGILKKFNTLEELAQHYKMPVEAFKKTVADYNSYVKAGKDPEFGKPTNMVDGITLSKAPFYAMRGTPKLHHTMGGLQINTQAQVIHSKTHQPIPGLYAAGEITGGVHGASRLGSVAITDCLTFGMIAGENI